ncbi:hypothetical protein A2160_02700 [Candidatus Beckwithbacteria bacterium RBG_13_42_9]|uniref:Uncharacterized protein n=1 Tax=Candidatus Beckwithbacteria bacterium RBG_13_42_9 TaxID=1797457 RepID=A0A1F5E7J6_9BACT|nr:MAG: hypothetical protein A2160_02700 [Candidatus Beckwithbacteria bacterium RBG_13_42_9]
MKKVKDLIYYMKLNYSVLLKKTKKSYYLFIPELSLIAEDKNLNTAYKKLEEEKRKYFKQILELNAQETIKEPLPIVIKNKLLAELVTFFLKTVIVLALLFILFVASFPFFRQIPNLALNSLIQFSNKATTNLKNTPPQEKEKELTNLREVIQDIKPFTDEIKVLWKNENSR